MNDTAIQFLQTYAAGGEVEGGWLYAKALQQTRLDFTPESLRRLDHLLGQIRERAKPSAADLDSPPGRNFQSLLAYYVIEVVRRRTGGEFEWHDRASALAALPAGTQLPEGTQARLVAINDDQGVGFWPLGWVEAQLAADGPRRLAGDLIDNMAVQIERHGPAVWWRAAFMLGQMAAWEMMAAAGPGGNVVPTMLSSATPRTFVMLAGSVYGGENLAESVQRGAKKLDENPEGATWQVLGYDGILEQDGQRLDSIMVVAKTYGDKPLWLKLAFPYLPPRDGRPFAILKPVQRESSVEREMFERMLNAIDRGIQSLKWPRGESWDAHRAAAPAKSVAWRMW